MKYLLTTVISSFLLSFIWLYYFESIPVREVTILSLIIAVISGILEHLLSRIFQKLEIFHKKYKNASINNFSVVQKESSMIIGIIFIFLLILMNKYPEMRNDSIIYIVSVINGIGIIGAFVQDTGTKKE